jgi:hypothetical protein
MTTPNKFIKHFRDLQAGENEKAGAAETLAYLNGLYLKQELIYRKPLLYVGILLRSSKIKLTGS